MPIGPGRYDNECQTIHETSKADVVMLLIVNGDKGSGFSLSSKEYKFIKEMPAMLRYMAEKIEADLAKVN